MSSVCIVTDSSAQFTQPTFVGRNLVQIIPLNIRMKGTEYSGGDSLKVTDFPNLVNDSFNPALVPPTIDNFRQAFTQAGQVSDQILGIFLSKQLNSCFECAEEAATSLRGRLNIQLIDSESTAIGLGIMVQIAAELAWQQHHISEIEKSVRNLIPRIFGVICPTGLSYMYYSGYIDRAQAAVSEILGLFPLFALEEGKFSPLEKVKNHRQVLDFYQEFLDEFDHIQHIAYIQSSTPNHQDSRLLREHAQDSFNKVPFTEHTINLPLAAMVGPSTTGLMIVETTGKKTH